MRGNGEVVELWFSKADEDELNIKSILKHRDGTPSAACFLSQQMAEKYLKALLIFEKNELIKTHHLVKLKEIIAEVVPDINAIHEEANNLNDYYIETRYVGDFPQFSWRDAEEAYDAAKKIKEFVLDKVR